MAECLRRRVKVAVLWAGFEYPCGSKSSSTMAQLVFRTQGHTHKTGVTALHCAMKRTRRALVESLLGRALRLWLRLAEPNDLVCGP